MDCPCLLFGATGQQGGDDAPRTLSRTCCARVPNALPFRVRSRDKTWATPPGLLRRYTYRCGGFFPGYDQVGCSMSNLQCGNSIM